MPHILPLRGLRYTENAGSLDDLLAPPYDVITPAQQRALAERSPYNAVRLELAEGGEERYAAVAALLAKWQDEGALARDDVPMLYVYEQEFEEAGRRHRRRALLAGVEAQPWEEGAVKPHEFTMSGPKEDRLKLLEATRTQFSPVFMIARDRAGQLAQFLGQTMQRPPDLEGTTIEGDVHRVWLVEAGRFEMRALAPMLAESFYIADGHHRYETAVAYKGRLAEREGTLPRDHPSRFALTAIVPASDPGLVIRSIHRFVPRQAPAGWREEVEALFEVEQIKFAGVDGTLAGEIERLLAQEPTALVAYNLEPEQFHVLRRRAGASVPVPSGRSDAWGALPANVLRYGVLAPLWGIGDAELEAGAVQYTHDTVELLEQAEGQSHCAAFFIAPVTIDDVMSLADEGQRMPQKTTFFYPKLGTGIVFHPLDG